MVEIVSIFFIKKWKRFPFFDQKVETVSTILIRVRSQSSTTSAEIFMAIVPLDGSKPVFKMPEGRACEKKVPNIHVFPTVIFQYFGYFPTVNGHMGLNLFLRVADMVGQLR